MNLCECGNGDENLICGFCHTLHTSHCLYNLHFPTFYKCKICYEQLCNATLNESLDYCMECLENCQLCDANPISYVCRCSWKICDGCRAEHIGWNECSNCNGIFCDYLFNSESSICIQCEKK